jgi:MFS superfamily sulfate permease-like transporter
MKVVPPQVIAAAAGLVLASFLGLKGDHLIHIPDEPFKHGIVLPNFRGVFADPSLWLALATTVLTLTMIDGIESLATIAAIDKIDPFRRKSDPNRTLFAMGVSNVCSSMAGGLTIIPGGVKSTACIVSGGRTQWANFYNACFLVLYLLLGRGLINMLPMSALGAIVIYTGYKLCAPKVWKHVAHIGGEQLFVFTTTVLVTVSTDLLWGIAAGIVAKLLLEAAIEAGVERGRPAAGGSIGPVMGHWIKQTGELFRNPVLQSGAVGNEYHVYFGRPLVCFNTMHLDAALQRIPGGSTSVFLHVTDLVTLIDHTAASALMEFVENFKQSGRGVARIVGLDRLHARSRDEACMRVSAPVLAQERAEALAELARISLISDGREVLDPIAYLEHISLTHVGPDGEWPDHPITLALVGTCRYVVRQTAAGASFVWTFGVRGAVSVAGESRRREWFSLPPDNLDEDWPPSLNAEYSIEDWPPSVNPEGPDQAWPPSLR